MSSDDSDAPDIDFGKKYLKEKKEECIQFNTQVSLDFASLLGENLTPTNSDSKKTKRRTRNSQPEVSPPKVIRIGCSDDEDVIPKSPSVPATLSNEVARLVSDSHVEPVQPQPRKQKRRTRSTKKSASEVSSAQVIRIGCSDDEEDVIPRGPLKPATVNNQVVTLDSDSDVEPVPLLQSNEFGNQSLSSINISQEYTDDVNYEQVVFVKWMNNSTNVHKIKLRRFQKLHYLREYFSEIAKIPVSHILLTLNDEKIYASDTLEDLQLTIKDILVAGILSKPDIASRPAHLIKIDPSIISLKVQYGSKNPLTVRIRKREPLIVLMEKVAEELGITKEEMEFEFDGEKLNPKSTPEDEDMDGGECIDVKIKQ